jgi:hypothetical protein
MEDNVLEQIRVGAELQNYAPFINDDLDKMKRRVVSQVMMQIDKGELTAEGALSRWHEFVSYERLSQRVNKKIVAGQELAKSTMPKEL